MNHEAPLAVLCAWLLFGGSHVLLGFPPLRNRLSQALGERGFLAAFSAIAAIGLAALALAVAWLGDLGPAGPGRWVPESARVVLAAFSIVGLVLAAAALHGYGRSPMVLLRTRFPPPTGVARITRHGFFVGFGLFALGHALLAATLAQSIHFLGYAVLAAIGALWQDRKLLARYGSAYADYCAQTSVVPFLALSQGRQRFVAQDRIGRVVLIALATTAVLGVLHPVWTAWNGAAFTGLLALGGVAVSLRRGLHKPRSTELGAQQYPDQ